MPESGTPLLGVPPKWLRGHATYDGTLITLDATRATEYEPWELADSLPFDLAGVRKPHEAVAFVQKHGLLWHGSGSKDLTEPFEDWERAIGRLTLTMALHETLRRAAAGEEDGQDALRQLLEPFMTGLASDKELYRQASFLISNIVTTETRGMTGGLTSAAVIWEDGDPTEFIQLAYADSLLAYAFHSLQQRVILPRVPLKACADCRAFFSAKDPRQKYCDNTCGNRARQRRWQEQQEGAEK